MLLVLLRRLNHRQERERVIEVVLDILWLSVEDRDFN
jgi:hypothetical protein